jgi:hypothetical protein
LLPDERPAWTGKLSWKSNWLLILVSLFTLVLGELGLLFFLWALALAWYVDREQILVVGDLFS